MPFNNSSVPKTCAPGFQFPKTSTDRLPAIQNLSDIHVGDLESQIIRNSMKPKKHPIPRQDHRKLLFIFNSPDSENGDGVILLASYSHVKDILTHHIFKLCHTPFVLVPVISESPVDPPLTISMFGFVVVPKTPKSMDYGLLEISAP